MIVASSSSSAPPGSGWAARPRSACSAPAAPPWTTRPSQGALRFGNVQHKALPCQGSRGRTQTYQVADASQLVPVPVLLERVTYQVNGDQFRTKDVAKGWSRTAIGSVSIPVAQLVISDVSSRAAMRGKPGKRVVSKVSTAIGSITVGGQPVAVPAPGGTVELPNGIGVIQRQLVQNDYRGSQVIALRIKLFQEAVVIDLGPHLRTHLPELRLGQQRRRVASGPASRPQRRAWATSGKTTLAAPTNPTLPSTTHVVIRPGFTCATAWASS